MLDDAPDVDLGSALTIRWKVPGPNNELDEIVPQTLTEGLLNPAPPKAEKG